MTGECVWKYQVAEGEREREEQKEENERADDDVSFKSFQKLLAMEVMPVFKSSPGEWWTSFVVSGGGREGRKRNRYNN